MAPGVANTTIVFGYAFAIIGTSSSCPSSKLKFFLSPPSSEEIPKNIIAISQSAAVLAAFTRSEPSSRYTHLSYKHGSTFSSLYKQIEKTEVMYLILNKNDYILVGWSR